MRNEDIYLMNADGSALRRLTYATTPLGVGQPSWSPDGQQIAFTVARVQPYNLPAIGVMNADGTGVQQLTDCLPGCSDAQPAWSPDGTLIAFVRTTSSSPIGNQDVWVVRPDGVDARSLTNCAAIAGCVAAGDPEWSPDGHQLAFTVEGHDSVRQLFVMNSDGSGVHPLLAKTSDICCMAWQPTTAEAPTPLVGTLWRLAALSWNGKSVAPNPGHEPTALFTADGGLSGTDGCNTYSATYQTGEHASISIKHWMQTLVLCNGSSPFDRAMVGAARYRIDDRFLRLSGDGAAIVFSTGDPIEPSAAISSTIPLDPRDGRTFEPPPSGTQPSLSATQALAAFMIVDRLYRPQPDATTWLGIYPWPHSQLAWGFRYHACISFQHSVGPDFQVICTRWLFLNANTGRMLEDIAQQPPP